jgi:hypothetical protein
MGLRTLAAVALATALSTGCQSAGPRWPAARATAPDPSKWERAACRIERYPQEIDGSALARARADDLRARQQGRAPSGATERVERERAAFDARCAAWRGELAQR